MVAGLLAAFALGAPVDQPGVLTPESHRAAVTKFGEAIWNIRRERLLTAVKQLEAAAKQDPDATAPLRELVHVYSQIGREPDAIRVAKQVLAKDPLDAETAHALARLLFDMGELKEAVAAAKFAAEMPLPIDRAAKTVAACRDLATLCEKANDPATAEIALRKTVELLVDQRKDVIAARAFTPEGADTAAAECLERLGKILTKRQKFEEAATAFETAAKLYADPKVNEPHSAARLGWNLSGVYQAKGDTATAIKHLEGFLKLRPIVPEPYARLAKLLRELERDAEAVARLEAYAEKDPENLAIKVVLAAEKARNPVQRGEADRLFAKVMAATNDPKLVEVVIRSHLEMSQPGQIIAELDRVFSVIKEDKKDEKPATPENLAAKAFAAEKAWVIGEILRSDADATLAVLRTAADELRAGVLRTHQVYYFLGQLAARNERLLGFAATYFQEAVRHSPEKTQGEAYESLISVLRRAGKPEQVVRACQDGLQHTQGLDLIFNYHMAAALAELGKADEAIAAADKAISQTGDSFRLTVRLQKVYVLRLLGKWDDAAAMCKKLLDEFDSRDDQLRTRYELAGVYWGAKKMAEAEAELRAILDIDPDHSAACNDLGYHLADQSRNLDEAERLIRNALATDRLDRKKAGFADPENAAYIDSLGWVLFRKGKLAEARTELERAAALPAGAIDPVVWDHLGDVLFRLGEKAKAKTMWEKAEGLYESEPRGSRGRRDGRLDELKRKLKRVP